MRNELAISTAKEETDVSSTIERRRNLNGLVKD